MSIWSWLTGSHELTENEIAKKKVLNEKCPFEGTLDEAYGKGALLKKMDALKKDPDYLEFCPDKKKGKDGWIPTNQGCEL